MNLLLSVTIAQSSSARNIGGNGHPSPGKLPNIDEDITEQVYSIIHSDGSDVVDLERLYLETVRQWLPILNRQRLPQRMKILSESPNLQLALLLLSIYLITRVPCRHQPPEGMQNNLYTTIKKIFLLLQAAERPSLELLQAGALITLYEHGHGIPDKAYVTIGICARLGQAMGLHLLEDLSNVYFDPEAEVSESKVTWHAVLMFDR